MEEVNLVVESLKFMILGMGIVFTFLTVMIFALKLQAKLIAKFFPEEVTKDISSTWKPQVKQEDEKDTIAAITAAIIHHNNNKNKG
ncbi:MAG: OadG family transporter subunit [Campylobacterota bacterium]|nr:OadG family transporter subunit [Campylobacterota bacterium]